MPFMSTQRKRVKKMNCIEHFFLKGFPRVHIAGNLYVDWKDHFGYKVVVLKLLQYGSSMQKKIIVMNNFFNQRTKMTSPQYISL